MTVGLGVFWSLLHAQYLEEYLAYHSHLLKEGLHRESDWSVSSLNVDCVSVCDTTGETCSHLERPLGWLGLVTSLVRI